MGLTNVGFTFVTNSVMFQAPLETKIDFAFKIYGKSLLVLCTVYITTVQYSVLYTKQVFRKCSNMLQTAHCGVKIVFTVFTHSLFTLLLQYVFIIYINLDKMQK